MAATWWEDVFRIGYLIMAVVVLVTVLAAFDVSERANGNMNEMRVANSRLMEQVADMQYQMHKDCGPCAALAQNNTVFVDRVLRVDTFTNGYWQSLLRDFARNHTYDLYNYNCVDYSRDAVVMLKQAGYDARQVTGHCYGAGYNETQMNHAWVEVSLWYEPQSGEMINRSECTQNM